MELCIDFGGTEIKLALFDGARVTASDSIPVRGDVSDLAAAMKTARRISEDTFPTALGIAVPGVVDPTTERMLHANAKYAFLDDFDLRAWAAAELNLPVIVENDARAALVGETTTGSAAGARDAVLVTLGTGIGTAAMIDGVPMRGHSGHAGILGGHVTTDINGPVCPCGNVGCGEALASSWALRRVGSHRSLNERLEAKDLFTSDEHTDVRESFLQVWGATAVTLIHMYDPSVVILSGGILRAGDAVSTPVESYVREHLWPSITPPQFIVPPEPELSVARGLSVLARRATASPGHEENQ